MQKKWSKEIFTKIGRIWNSVSIFRDRECIDFTQSHHTLTLVLLQKDLTSTFKWSRKISISLTRYFQLLLFHILSLIHNDYINIFAAQRVTTLTFLMHSDGKSFPFFPLHLIATGENDTALHGKTIRMQKCFNLSFHCIFSQESSRDSSLLPVTWIKTMWFCFFSNHKLGYKRKIHVLTIFFFYKIALGPNLKVDKVSPAKYPKHADPICIFVFQSMNWKPKWHAQWYTNKDFGQCYCSMHQLLSQTGRVQENCYCVSIYTDFGRLRFYLYQDCIRRQIFSC